MKKESFKQGITDGIPIALGYLAVSFTFGIVGGTTIRIIADGADEQAAVDGLIKLVESGFAE